MERYNEYKDSGVQWLGEIPSHWGILPGRVIFDENKKKNDGSDRSVLSLSYGKIVVKNDINEGLVPAEYSNYQIIEPGYIIVRCTDLQNDKVSLRTAISLYSGIITSAYLGLVTKNDQNSFFINYLLRAWDNCKELYRYGSGLRQSLSWVDFKYLLLPIPPKEEQDAMVAYLDEATSKIDAAIAQQQKMIDLLNERKQIIINNAVTKGLNPNVKMKDSGVDWIGEIPSHWEVKKLKHVTSKIGSGSTPRGGAEVYSDFGVRFLRSQNVYNDGLKLADVAYITDNIHAKMKGTQVKYNDILYNITGGSIGRCCCYTEYIDANVNQHVSIVRPLGIMPKFLMFCLQSSNAQRQLRITLKGGNREGLAAETFKEFLIIVPPFNEQQKIVEDIKDKFVTLNQAIESAEKQIALLQERKQIIINEVVTGKVKVS